MLRPFVATVRPFLATILAAAALSACAGDLDATGLDPQDDAPAAPAREPRKMSSNKMSSNKMSSNALTANPEALGQLIAWPLSTSTFVEGGSPVLRKQLEDRDAREVLHYIVDCALPGDQVVTWTSVFGTGGEDFRGGLGLCSAWAGGPPDERCMELVSACVLARVNAFGIKVALRLDGEPAPLFAIEERTPVTTWNRDGNPIASFATCWSTQWGPSRDCGWKPDYVGTCTPGEWVQVGAGANVGGCTGALGKSTGDSMLRVCEGISGCDHAQKLVENDDSCGLKPAVGFTCPWTGKFSVMTAAWNSAVPYYSEPGAAAPAWLPAPDYAAFDVKEGAFFGNIFDPAALNPQLHVTVINPNTIIGKDAQFNGPAFRNMWACWSERWLEGEAYFMHRICSGPSANERCVATVVGACGESRFPTPVTHVCSVPDGNEVIGNGDVHECVDHYGRSWSSPVTVWLSEPCAIVDGYCQ